jgi:predicted O-methyltransferase YrrM/glycosyltransferase involved in cell wall biosynthesis
MKLSLAILAHNSEQFIERLLQAGAEFADELIIGVDRSSTDSTEDICAQYADKLFRLEPIGTSERALAWLNDQCSGDWILRLDDDELPSAGFVNALPRLMRDRNYTHYWLPRRWVVGDERSRWIAEHPWWPDWQIRFFRNIPSLVSFPGQLHTDYEVQGAGGYFSEGSLYHYALVERNEQQRREKVAQYERISPGNSQPWYYFPNDATLVTRANPADDPPWRGGPEPRFRSPHEKTRSISVTEVSLAEMRRAERKEVDYPPDLYRATLDCSDCPSAVVAGRLHPVEIRLRNDSPHEWPSPGLGGPEILLSYRWLHSTREPHRSLGVRTRLPLTLRPGDTLKVIAHVLAPWQSGRYLLQWDPLIENVTWFSTQGWKGPETEVRVDRATGDPGCLDRIAEYLDESLYLPGWYRGEEARTLALLSHSLPEEAVIVEIGSFLGSGTMLLAGPRKVRGSGKVHCVDPFDCSGDAFSVPVYQQLLTAVGGGPLRQRFEENLARAGLDNWVQVHQGRAAEIAATWTSPVDLLLLDGDQSRLGARAAYESWLPFLKPGGIIAVHNTEPRVYAPDHDGNRRLVLEEIVPPRFTEVRLIGATTFARRLVNQSD